MRDRRPPEGSVVNEVELVYNEWSQSTEDRQAHAGAAGGSTPKVAYQYENGSANHVRLKKISHPDGNNVVDLLYGTGGGQDDPLSRLKHPKLDIPIISAKDE